MFDVAFIIVFLVLLAIGLGWLWAYVDTLPRA